MDGIICFCRFTVRDFVYNEEDLLAEKNEVTKLNTDMRKQFVSSLNYYQFIVLQL